MTETERLTARLMGLSIIDARFMPGGAAKTVEDVAREANKALDELERRIAAGEPLDAPPHSGREQVEWRTLTRPPETERSQPIFVRSWWRRTLCAMDGHGGITTQMVRGPYGWFEEGRCKRCGATVEL